MISFYQTLITGVIGFIGIILSILANGWLARNQHQRDIQHKRKTILSAVKAELSVNLSTFELRVEILKKPVNGLRTAIPSKVFNQVYNEMLNQIGILSESEAKTIINIYLLIEELPDRSRLLLSNQDYSIDGFIVITDKDKRDNLKEAHEEYIKMIKSAITSLS